MNNGRYDILRQAFGQGARAAEVTLFLVAKEHGVTVDAVVQAGLGRGGPDCCGACNTNTSNAPRAAAAIKAKVPDFFKALEAHWPYVCHACSSDVTRLNQCPECKARKVCDGCLTRHGCPDCALKAERLKEQRAVQYADAEANAKWLKRQLAEPLPEPEEPAGLPTGHEEPEPPPPPPADATYPEPVHDPRIAPDSPFYVPPPVEAETPEPVAESPTEE